MFLKAYSEEYGLIKRYSHALLRQFPRSYYSRHPFEEIRFPVDSTKRYARLQNAI